MTHIDPEIERIAKALYAAGADAYYDPNESYPAWEETSEEAKAAARELARVAKAAMGGRVQPGHPNVREDDYSWVDVRDGRPPENMRVELYFIQAGTCWHEFGNCWPESFTGRGGGPRLTHWRYLTDPPLKQVSEHSDIMKAPPRTLLQRLVGR